MLTHGFTHMVNCFMLYSALGWLLESAWCSVAARKPLNRGFLAGPYCPAYGLGAAVMAAASAPFAGNPLLVFLICTAAAALMELLTGGLLEALFRTRWWDYSGQRFQIKGRISLRNSVLFGALGLTATLYVQPVLDDMLPLLSSATQRVAASLLIGLLVFDLARTLFALSGLELRLKELHDYMIGLDETGAGYPWLDPQDIPGSIDALRRLQAQGRASGDEIAALADIDAIIGDRNASARIIRAFPGLMSKDLPGEFTALRDAWTTRRRRLGQRLRRLGDRMAAGREAAKIELRLAYRGISASKLVWVFLIGCIIGYIVETVTCLISTGAIESRQGMVYGPFSQVYGFGAVVMTLVLAPFAHKGDGWLYLGSALVGGLFEALCSYVQEMLFGTVSWQYSSHTGSFFGGRTNLLYMFFWGLLGTVYMKYIYPKISELIGIIPKRAKRFFTWAIAIFLAADLLLSGLAVDRWTSRLAGAPPANMVQAVLDERFPDDVMEEIYPNMKQVEK